MDTNNFENINPSAAPSFRGQVLQKVYRVWLWRKFLPVIILEVAAFSFVLYELAKLIFMQHFIDNAVAVFIANPPKIFSFLAAAFEKTRLITKIFSIAAVVLAALILRLLTQGLLRLILVKENYFGKMSSK